MVYKLIKAAIASLLLVTTVNAAPNTVGNIPWSAVQKGVGFSNSDVTNATVTVDNTNYRAIFDKSLDTINVKDFGAKCDGNTDDTVAFQNAINKATASGGLAIKVPASSNCILSGGLIANINNGPFHLYSNGKHGATLSWINDFQGIGLDLEIHAWSSHTTASVEGITFEHRGKTTSGTALKVNANIAVQAGSVQLSHVSFTRPIIGDTSSWDIGTLLYNTNVDYVSDYMCFNFNGHSCLKYDAYDGGADTGNTSVIDVEHHISDFYMNSASGVGIDIGHKNMSAPLQGFSIISPSCTGGDICINSIGNTSAVDEITVVGAQINSTNYGVYTDGADTVTISNSYFIGVNSNSSGIYIKNSQRPNINNNVLLYNSPNNVILTLDHVGMGGYSGIVSNNLFTGNYKNAVNLINGTDYIYINGNNCFTSSTCILDSTLGTGTSNVQGINDFGRTTHIGSQVRFSKVDNNGNDPSITSGENAGSTINDLVLQSGKGSIINQSNSGITIQRVGNTPYPYSSNISTDGVGNTNFTNQLGNTSNFVFNGSAEIGNQLSIDGTNLVFNNKNPSLNTYINQDGTGNTNFFNNIGSSANWNFNGTINSTKQLITHDSLILKKDSNPYTTTINTDGVGNTYISNDFGTSMNLKIQGMLFTPYGFMTDNSSAINRQHTLAQIQKEGHNESDKVWCHDCLNPGQTTGKGTGAYIYMDSTNVWYNMNGTVAAN